MAGNLTDTLENLLLEHSTGRAAWAAPTSTYCALFLVAPTDSTGGTEVSGGNYGRGGASPTPISWGAASGGSIANNADIDFGTASANWGSIVALGIFDNPTLGTLLWYGTLGSIVTVNTSDSFKITSGGLILSLD